MTIYLIPLSGVLPNPWQTRSGVPNQAYNIKELALDIAAHGLLQTPVGRLVAADGTPIRDAADPAPWLEHAENGVQLAFGHNRLAAYKWLYDLHNNSDISGDFSLPPSAKIRRVRTLHNNSDISGDFSAMPIEIKQLTDEQMAIMAWSENEHRRDHTPLERALAIQRRIEHFGWSQQEVAAHLGISRPVVANALRLLKLPDDIRQKLHTGDISERQAAAILELFGLPDSIRKTAANSWQIDTNPANILADALHGESSERTRCRIELLLEKFCRKLDGAIWSLDDSLGDITPCRACEWRIIQRNVCSDPICHQRKEYLAQRAYLQRASESSGIPVNDGGKTDITEFDWGDKRKSLPAIIQAGCENLRLDYRCQTHPREETSNLAAQGFPHAEIVCLKRSGWCTCLKGAEFMRRQQEQVTKRAEQDARDRYDEEDPENLDDDVDIEDIAEGGELVEAPASDTLTATAADYEAAARAAGVEKRRAAKLQKAVCELAGQRLWQALESKSPLAWRILANHLLTYKLSYDKTESTFAEWTDICYQLGFITAEKLMPFTPPDSVADLLARVNQDLKRAGLQPITEDDLARQA